MIPAEVIERAREAAYRKSCDWAAGGANIGDAALRSLLTDLSEHLVFEPPSCGRPHVTGGVIASLLRELGDE